MTPSSKNSVPLEEKPTPAIPTSVADATASTSPTKYRWTQVTELGYEEGSNNNATNVEDEEAICFHCGKVAEEAEGNKLSKCAKCGVASYW